jgi:hypothetical protein
MPASYSQFTTFAGKSLIFLLLNITILWLVVGMFAVNYMAAKILARHVSS